MSHAYLSTDMSIFFSFFSEIPADKLGELLNDIEQSETSIMSWKQHIIRCSNQDHCRLDLIIDGLKTDEVLVIMDSAIKFLPLSFREKQSEWFAQKGMNWHICVCVYKFEDNTIQVRDKLYIFICREDTGITILVCLFRQPVSLSMQNCVQSTTFICLDVQQSLCT